MNVTLLKDLDTINLLISLCIILNIWGGISLVDWISISLSIFALLVSFGSVWYARKQYRLNQLSKEEEKKSKEKERLLGEYQMYLEIYNKPINPRTTPSFKFPLNYDKQQELFETYCIEHNKWLKLLKKYLPNIEAELQKNIRYFSDKIREQNLSEINVHHMEDTLIQMKFETFQKEQLLPKMENINQKIQEIKLE